MKQFRRPLALVCALLIAALALSPAYAGSRKANAVKALKLATWFRADIEDTVYRLSLNSDSLLTYKWQYDADTEGTMYLEIYRKSSCSESSKVAELEGRNMATEERTRTGTGYMPLEKGTYYVRLRGKASVKVTTKAIVLQTNYSLASATKLKRNKAVSVISLPNDHFRRWFRLKNTATRPLTITVVSKNGNYDRYIVYCPKDPYHLYTMEDVAEESTGGKHVMRTTESVKPGTYYIYASSATYYSLNDRQGYYYTIKWN